MENSHQPFPKKNMGIQPNPPRKPGEPQEIQGLFKAY